MPAPGGGVPDADRKVLFLPTPIVWTDKNSLFKYPEKFLLLLILSTDRDRFAAVHTIQSCAAMCIYLWSGFFFHFLNQMLY